MKSDRMGGKFEFSILILLKISLKDFTKLQKNLENIFSKNIIIFFQVRVLLSVEEHVFG